ncbi:MAG TPA: hypothetical protein VGZ93_11830 [Candidatus Methylacidiphilales bacterium]|jgi:hypothetical protein|nr:hypothetical protein [Candidatus Methylacidiphilales bacterium]
MKYLSLILATGLALTARPVRADGPVVPGAGFAAARYEMLWTKSPFAVATPEAGEDSTDYILYGITKIDGTSYASVVDKQNPLKHYLISSDKATEGLTLSSVIVGANGSDTFAVLEKDGQTITLKLEPPPTAAAGPGTGSENPMNMPPGMMSQQLQMPGANPTLNASGRPFGRFRRSLIHLPPQPEQQQLAQPQQPVQVHAPPPPPPGQ